MANQVHVFKDRDVKRLLRLARAEGLNPFAVEVDVKTRKIKVIGVNPSTTGGQAANNEWDEVTNGVAKDATRQ